MVRMIVGSRGTGKTKRLIQMVNHAGETSKGNVVCIEQGDALRYDIGYNIRLINIQEYYIQGIDAYSGFVAGLLAGNYDITEIYADATFKILCGQDQKDFEVLADFIQKLEELTAHTEACVYLTVSCDVSDIPERIRQYIME